MANAPVAELGHVQSALKFSADLNLYDYFLGQRIAEGRGSRTAVLWGERQYSFTEVAERSLQVAALLDSLGIRRGERVLVALPDSPVWAWVLFGIFARGAVVAMANPDAPAAQMDYLVEYTRATAVVTLPRIASALIALRAAGKVCSEVQALLVVADLATGEDPDATLAGSAFEAELTPVPASGKSMAIIDLAHALARQELCAAARVYCAPKMHRDEPCMWLFTSGSTGEPKANIHAHRDFAFNTEVYAKQTVGYSESDRTLSVSRLYFGYATGTNLFFPFAVGAATALFSERPTPEVLMTNLVRYRPTIVTNVPTMLGKLLEFQESELAAGRPGLDLSSVRFSLSAGEALPEALLRRWQSRFGSDVYDGIGSAEMFHIYASNRPGDIKPGSLGRVVTGYDLTILPEDAAGAGAPPCAPGEIGVLWVRGDSVSFGYWLDRDKSFSTFHGHSCRTGDLFHVDAGGYLYFDGRADDLLKVGGLWVAPHEIEEHLVMHDSVAQAAVIGVVDEGLTKACAFVVVRSGAEATIAHATLSVELIEFLRGRISKYKVPKLIRFVSDLPKNDRGKVDKKALRELANQLGPLARS